MRSIRASTDAIAGARVGVAAAVGVLSLSTLVACSDAPAAPIPSAHPDEVEPRRGGTLTVASFGDIRTLDPANVGDGLVPLILQGAFAGLIDYDADGKLQPDLAERWSVADDGRSLRFVLREGVRFHDGEEVTADDVKRSTERALHPSAPNPYSSYFESIVGYADFVAKKTEHLAGVAVDGRFVVTFHLEAPDASFLPVLAMHMLRPVCRSGGYRYSDTWHPCGAGPFKLLPGGWDRGRQLTLVRHDTYFRAGLPHLDGVRFLFHVGPIAQRFKFTRGDQDILRDFLSPDLLKFQGDPRWSPHGGYEVEKQITGMAMNTEMPPFDNVEIRRAVAAAIDRDELRLVRPGNLTVGGGPVPPAIEGHDTSVRLQQSNFRAALEHMRLAGYPYDPVRKTGGWPHVVPYLVYSQGQDFYMGQVAQQQLAKIGIRLEIQVVNYPSFLALRGRRRQVAFGPGFWQQDYAEASSFLQPLFHSKSINDEESNNWSFYRSPRFDELVDRARREVDVSRRTKIYGEAEQIACDDAPWAFTHYYRWYAQWQPYVRDYTPHPMWTMDVKRTWLDRATGSVAGRAIFSSSALAKLFGDPPQVERPARGVAQ